MKIEFDMDHLFCKDGQTPIEFLRERVVDELVDRYLGKLEPSIDQRIAEIVKKSADEYASTIANKLSEDFLDHEYIEKGSWGENEKTWTIRQKIHAHLKDQCVIKNSPYPSDRTKFTQAILDAVDAKMSEFKKQFSNSVDATFLNQAFEYAAKQFAAKMPKAAK